MNLRNHWRSCPLKFIIIVNVSDPDSHHLDIQASSSFNCLSPGGYGVTHEVCPTGPLSGRRPSVYPHFCFWTISRKPMTIFISYCTHTHLGGVYVPFVNYDLWHFFWPTYLCQDSLDTNTRFRGISRKPIMGELLSYHPNKMCRCAFWELWHLTYFLTYISAKITGYCKPGNIGARFMLAVFSKKIALSQGSKFTNVYLRR